MKKRIIGLLLAAALLGTMAPTSYADETALLPVPSPISGEIDAGNISKSGNVTLSITRDDFLSPGVRKAVCTISALLTVKSGV